LTELKEDKETAEIIAKEHGVSPRTVERAAEFAEAVDKLAEVDPALKEAALNGEITKAEVIAEAKPERKPKKTTDETPASANGEEADLPRDKVGHVIPAASATAFAVVAKFEELDALTRALQKGIDAITREPGGEQLRRHVTPTGTEDKKINKSEHLNDLKRDLKFSRPHSVCPYCKGKATANCKGCSGLGWVSELTWKNMADDVKARLA